MKKQLFVAALALGFASSALAQEVNTDYDRSANFGAIKTFAVKIGTSWGKPITEKRVMSEIEQGLASKGWKPAPEGDGRRRSWSCTGRARRRRTGVGATAAGAWAWASATTTESTSTRSAPSSPTSSTPRPSSSCSAAPRQDELSDKPEKNIKKIQKVAEKMFKKFPPGSEK